MCNDVTPIINLNESVYLLVIILRYVGVFFFFSSIQSLSQGAVHILLESEIT